MLVPGPMATQRVVMRAHSAHSACGIASSASELLPRERRQKNYPVLRTRLISDGERLPVWSYCSRLIFNELVS
jgi:hypothetical protein